MKIVLPNFVNPEPARVNHYYEFEVAPNNQWIDLEIDKDKTPFNDAKWNSGFDHATRCFLLVPHLRKINFIQ